MSTTMDQHPVMDLNPTISVTKDGTILYANVAGEPLLQEWGVRVGERLPLNFIDLVHRVISRNSPEKIEIKVGVKVYLIVFHPSPEEACVKVSGFDISEQKELEKKPQKIETQEKANLELAEIVDSQAIQSLMDDFYKLAHIPMSLDDLKGNVLVGVGWQDICTKFHRVNPETCKHCVESDTKLSAGVPPGEFKLYKCKNNMWDIVTPVIVGGHHIGNIFLGQFFFDDEPLDYELFRFQARKYGFNEEEYLAALEKVPLLSREAVDKGMSFLMKLANIISQLSYSNIKLDQLLSERDAMVDALQESEKRERVRSDELAVLIDAVPAAIWITHDFKALKITGNRLSYEWLGLQEGSNISKATPDGKRPETYKLFKNGVEIPLADMPVRMAASGREVQDYDFDIIYPDGTKRHLLGNAKSLLDKHGNPHGSVSAFIDITERKKAEEALRLSNIYNRSLIEASLDPLVTIGHDGKITDVNVATEKATGYCRNDLIGTDFSNYFNEPDKARTGYKQVFTNGEVRDYPLEIQHKDGHVTPILYNASVYSDDNGEIIGVFAAARDITERKKAEEALKNAYDSLEKLVEDRTTQLEKAYKSLKESEERLSEAQRMAHIGNYDHNLLANELYWSDELYRIVGLEPQEGMTYDRFLSYIHPDYRNYVSDSIDEALKGNVYAINYKIVRPDGEERVVHSERGVIFDERNNPVRIKGAIQDITEYKKAEEKLRESEEKYRNIVEVANEGISILDSEGKFTYINKKHSEMLGYSEKEIYGKYAGDFVEDVNSFKKEFEKRRLGVSKSYELKLVHKDGSPIWVVINAKSLFDDDGKFMGSLSMLTDITERKRAEEMFANFDIARQKEIHHRIKNNLQVISSLLDLQAEKFNDCKVVDTQEVLDAFRESQNRVISMALIHEELYKGNAFDTLNFSSYIKKLTDKLFKAYRFGNFKVALSMDLEENVFFNIETAIPLGIIVNELVSNSLKHAFSDRNEGEIRIKLHRKENGECIESVNEDCKSTVFILSISDNGIGIPEDLDIKDLDSLGLQLVTSLVDQLDGELELKRNDGTEFIIRFTVTEKENQASESALQFIELEDS